jgi:hypothetical protein
VNTAVIVFLACTLIGVALYPLVAEWFRTESRRLDALVGDALEDIDFRRWDREMSSQSPLFDDDGWLR